MKMKRLTKIVAGMAMVFTLGVAPLTSCSTIFGEDGITIKDITWVKDDANNNIIVTVKTTREDNPDIRITIPAGLPGVDGVGIKDVKTEINEENTKVTITIKYTDPKLDDTVVTIPIVHGKDGRGVEEVIVGNSEDGNVTIQFKYNDGTTSQLITIPKGIDGNGIENVEIDEKTDKNNIIVTIKFTNDEKPVEFKIPKGKDGISLVNVTLDESASDDKNYVLNLEYSDGFVGSVSLPKPQATIWHHGELEPENTMGKDGDYYLNVISGFVYYKSNGKWSFIFSMDGSGSYISKKVVFHPGEGKWVNPPYRDGEPITITLKYGGYIELSEFPVIERAGYDFGGWYTAENDINAGQFTDLTPVQKNMDLYPRWNIK